MVFLLAPMTDLPAWQAGTNIQRTMILLATSDPKHHRRVKVLFYGQSITKQDWWKSVAESLKRRFPYADLVCENRAIGGFDASRLKFAVQHDVFASYPDLIILHDYGGEPDYEELIRRIRSNVSSEILVQSDHYVNAEPRAQAWHDRHVDWLQALARRYTLGFVDIRNPWKRYLADHHLAPAALLSDGVHLNADGCTLMASLVGSALVYDHKLPQDRTLASDVPLRWHHGKCVLNFEGNRVDVSVRDVAGAPVQVVIDGKKPSEIPELYRIGRPSDCYKVDVPAVYDVTNEKLLLAEDWTLTLFDISPDVQHWRFKVKGSKTGEDGEGASDQPFVSRSGRVVIGPKSWYVHEAFGISGQTPPAGFQVKWTVSPQFIDAVPPGPARTLTIAQGLVNGTHTLELRCGTRPPPGVLTVHKPPLHGQ